MICIYVLPSKTKSRVDIFAINNDFTDLAERVLFTKFAFFFLRRVSLINCQQIMRTRQSISGIRARICVESIPKYTQFQLFNLEKATTDEKPMKTIIVALPVFSISSR